MDFYTNSVTILNISSNYMCLPLGTTCDIGPLLAVLMGGLFHRTFMIRFSIVLEHSSFKANIYIMFFRVVVGSTYVDDLHYAILMLWYR